MTDKQKENLNDFLLLHVAGATVKHRSKFSNLEVLVNDEPLGYEFCQKYIVPFYLTPTLSPEYKNAYLNIRKDVNLELISKLLGDFNWRPRSVGAYFSALESTTELESNIGNLLLRSDVCYAGYEYCLALASFSSTSAVEFLNQYLDYYLTKPELYFDQMVAMSALSYLGEMFEKDLLSPHMKAWDNFFRDKEHYDLNRLIEEFNDEMNIINNFKLQYNVK